MMLDNDVYELKPKFYPSFRYSEIIKFSFGHNVELDDLLFYTKGMRHAMKQSEKICFSEYLLEEPKIEQTRI